MPSYEIIIKHHAGEDDGSDSNLAGSGKSKEKENNAKIGKKIASAITYVATQATRELVVSKVGEVTRNNLLQQKIDVGIGLAQTAVAFMVDPVFGAVNLAINLISQTIDYNIKVEKQSNRLSVMAERAGYINRSRND